MSVPPIDSGDALRYSSSPPVTRYMWVAISVGWKSVSLMARLLRLMALVASLCMVTLEMEAICSKSGCTLRCGTESSATSSQLSWSDKRPRILIWEAGTFSFSFVQACSRYFRIRCCRGIGNLLRFR